MEKKRIGSIEIYDLDDTLLITPTFSELLQKDEHGNLSFDGEFGEFLKKIKSFFHIIFSKEIYFKPQGDFVVLYDAHKKAPIATEYIDHIQNLNPDLMASHGLKRGIVKDMVRALGTYQNHVVFKNIPQFHENPETIGKIVNDAVFRSYEKAHNKMILTGRNEVLKPKIEARLSELGLDFPNYGIFCFRPGKISIQDFKLNTILDSIAQNNWAEVHFYEDKREWLDAAMKAVSDKYPEVVFHPHLITISKRIESL